MKNPGVVDFNKFEVTHLFAMLRIWRGVVLFYHVPPKMGEAIAREVTQTTFVGLLSGVLALVQFQIPSLSG